MPRSSRRPQRVKPTLVAGLLSHQPINETLQLNIAFTEPHECWSPVGAPIASSLIRDCFKALSIVLENAVRCSG
jgi:hypothetical protein